MSAVSRKARSSSASALSLKMTRAPELVRDFIHDCLYNPEIGYFQRHVNIFSTRSHTSIPFRTLRDQDDYNKLVYGMYAAQTKPGQKFHQLWHTPSELFRPWYAQGIAEWALKGGQTCDSDPLIIYEVGPGNGSLCGDICEYIKDRYPEQFPSMEYHLVEISAHLVKKQLQALQLRFPKQIHVHNRSFLHWTRKEHRPSIILAMEMFDNLPQDRIRFVDQDGSLEQAMVITNDSTRFGDPQQRFTQVFYPINDSLILELVNTMEAINYPWPHLHRTIVDAMLRIWPLSLFAFDQPWHSEFIPTGLFSFLKTLVAYFPHHRFLMTDFDALPDAIPGFGGPVVQTRYEEETVACSTYLLERGLFDIFFPINFPLVAKILSHLQPKSPPNIQILKHSEFCSQYMTIKEMRTQSGYNPLLEDFRNVSFLLS